VVWAAVGVLLALGVAYFLGLAVAAGMALWHYRLIKGRAREGCFKAFRLNHWLGLAVFMGVLVDAWLK
jgi:4-hydroxybenzoate polyprenyltransferase